jgi:hypothetical protein
VSVAGALVAVAASGVAVVSSRTAVLAEETVALTFGVADVEAEGDGLEMLEELLLPPPQATSSAAIRPTSKAANSFTSGVPLLSLVELYDARQKYDASAH